MNKEDNGGKKMKKQDCMKREKKLRKTVYLSVRVTPELSKWMKKEKLSPTGIFDAAVKELGYNGN